MVKFDMLTRNTNCIGKEVLEFEKSQNKLPAELDYMEIEDGIAIVQPNKEVSLKLKGTVNEKILNKIDGDVTKIDEYIYNAQKPLSIESVFVNDILIPKEKIIIAPFKDLKFKELFIVPQTFSKDDYWEADVRIGKRKIKTRFIRSAYDGVGVRRYTSNVNDEFTITLEFFESNKFQCKIKFNMERVNNLNSIVRIEEYLRNIHTLQINKFKLGLNIEKFDNKLVEIVGFWKKVKALGKILKRRFTYKDEILQSEMDNVNNLYKSLVENKFCVHKNQVGSLSFKCKPEGTDSLPTNTPICIIAVGDVDMEIIDKKNKLFIEYIFVNYEFKGISEYIEDGEEVKFEIEPTDNSVILERYFVNENDRDKLHNEITSCNTELNKIINLYIKDIS